MDRPVDQILKFKLKLKVHVLPRYKHIASECLKEVLAAHITVPVTSLKQISHCFMSRKTVSCFKLHLE